MDPARAARALESWFAKNARDLPWRRTHDPYHVLVSEFILQQTRMETGLRYFEKFIARFPTIEALARARTDTVLRLWSGLGYYSRARNLHATARRIVREHEGVVPDDPLVLDGHPGIGPYTAGAIASIAYDRPVPAIDGNQARVLGRFRGLRSSGSSQQRSVEAAAREILRHGSPRTINQALMDLGSTICLPRNPNCPACPLAKGCRGRPLPQAPRRERSKPQTEHWEISLHVRGKRIWLRPPAPRGPLAHLWLPPMRPAARGDSGRPDLIHRFTHRTWNVRLVPARGPPGGRGRWVSRKELAGLPHSRLTVRVLDCALGARS